MRRARTCLSLLGFLGLMASCGSDTPTVPEPVSGGKATATPAPTATPRPAAAVTAAPTPSPTPDDREAIFDGPVKTVKVRLYSVVAPDGSFRPEPFYDERTDHDVAYKGDFIVMDVTPKNALGQKCDSEHDPIWYVDGAGGKLSRRASSNPFLYRADLVGNGLVTVRVDVDGVLSNFINIEIR
jgi:hypothetical protein